MIIPRVIPCLLLQEDCLYKTTRFKKPIYIGDAVNAVRILNEKEVDELVFLDFRASKEDRPPNLNFLRQVAEECFMPLAYGGGVNEISHVKQILAGGAEKVILSSVLEKRASLVTEAARVFGSQAIVVSIDVKRRWLGRPSVYTRSGTRKVADDPVEYAREVQRLGAGEILLTSIDNDGMQCGFDTDIIARVAAAVDIPVIANGGAKDLRDFSIAIDCGASAVAAGSMFVFHGKHNAVLITYPERTELELLFVEK